MTKQPKPDTYTFALAALLDPRPLILPRWAASGEVWWLAPEVVS